MSTGSPSLDAAPRVGDWIDLSVAGRLRVKSGKVEIGQRIATALVRIVADELALDPARVELAEPATGACPDEGYTSGSNSIEHSGAALRLASATLREHGLRRAAQLLDAPLDALAIDDGVIRAPHGNRTLSLWDLAGELQALDVDRGAPTRVTRGEPCVLGTTEPRGLRAIATGRARFVHDLVRPGMLHARVVRPPRIEQRLETPVDAIARALPGLEVVHDGSFLALAAEDEFAVVRAVQRLRPRLRWSPPAPLASSDPAELLASRPRESLEVVSGVPRPGPVPHLRPPAAAVLDRSASYLRPFQLHASLAPSAALARLDGDTLRIESHSQGIYPLRAVIAQALGMDEARVSVRHVPGAGCYGHNGADDAAFDAALVACALPGRPILLKWSREDEHGHEPAATAMRVDLRAWLDVDGRIVAWRHDVHGGTHSGRPRTGPGGVGPSRLLAATQRARPAATFRPSPSTGRHAGNHRNADPLYDVGERRIVKHLVHDLPLRTSSMRSLGAFANVFAIESFMDELAHAHGDDPLAFRMRHLSDARAVETLRAAADAVGWPPRRAPGRGVGLGFARYKNAQAFCAVAVEVEVDERAEIGLVRAVIAADAGRVVDRAGLEAQLEGGFMQAASWTLYEEATFDADGIGSRDWATYPVIRFDNVPDTRTIAIDRPGSPSLGAGECACGPAGAAIANAVFAATGLRARRLPITADGLRQLALS